MNDTERLDWLEKLDGVGLISDDAGRWAISDGGIQNMPDPGNPIDIASSFFVERDDWRNTIREAIDAGIEKQENE